jgi:hypothetical protein
MSIQTVNAYPISSFQIFSSYVKEFVRIYNPLIFKILVVVITLLKLDSILSMFQFGDASQGEYDVFDRNNPIVEEEAIELKKEVDEKYSQFIDDKAAAVGTENDIYMIKTHGYDKYRFVSDSFLKRNSLVRDRKKRARSSS